MHGFCQRFNRTAVFLVFLVAGGGSARAATIEFDAIDLGAGLWQYDYFVSGVSFAADEGFATFFDVNLYSDLVPIDLPLAVASDWDILVLQPDLVLPDDGIYDALALVNSASLEYPFSVIFSWLGAAGTSPGIQPFEIYRLDGEGQMDLLETGFTVPRSAVPEPALGLLLLLAAGARGVRHVRARRRPAGWTAGR
jgi:hypothetical protein